MNLDRFDLHNGYRAPFQHRRAGSPAGVVGRLGNEGALVPDRRIGLCIEQRVLRALASDAVDNQPCFILIPAYRDASVVAEIAIDAQCAARQLAVQSFLQATHRLAPGSHRQCRCGHVTTPVR
jgi:hypothetical protein